MPLFHFQKARHRPNGVGGCMLGLSGTRWVRKVREDSHHAEYVRSVKTAVTLRVNTTQEKSGREVPRGGKERHIINTVGTENTQLPSAGNRMVLPLCCPRSRFLISRVFDLSVKR